MGAIETFCFGEFKLRPAGTTVWDHRLAKVWNDSDRYHNGKMAPQFWTEQGPHCDSYILEDRSGPLFFAKLYCDGVRPALSAQIFIQFSPALPRSEAKAQILRVRAGLTQGFEWLERMLAARKVKELYFDSESEMLIRFCVSKLGFSRSGNVLTKAIKPEELGG